MKHTLFLIIAIISISATNRFSITDPVLTEEAKQNCLDFRNLIGQNRIDIFKKIQPLLRVVDKNIASNINMLGANLATQEEIISVLGNPDAILDGNFLQYNLKISPSACKVVMAFNKSNQLVFCTIKDCN